MYAMVKTGPDAYNTLKILRIKRRRTAAGVVLFIKMHQIQIEQLWCIATISLPI